MVGGRIEDATPAEDHETAAVREDLRKAYERGRLDERARRKRHPIGMTLTFAAAIVGVVVLALALVNGSFEAAGQSVDHGLSIAKPAASQAASTAGQKLRDAAG